MNKIRLWFWEKLSEYFHLYKKDKESGIEYVIPYGKNKIVQFFHIFSLYRYAWHLLSFRTHLIVVLYNCGWINDRVEKRMFRKKKWKGKNWQINSAVFDI